MRAALRIVGARCLVFAWALRASVMRWNGWHFAGHESLPHFPVSNYGSGAKFRRVLGTFFSRVLQRDDYGLMRSDHRGLVSRLTHPGCPINDT